MHAIAAVALGVFLAVTGVMHFLTPGHFHALVPAWLHGARLLVAVTGAAEVVVGALVLVPCSRPVGGWATAFLITCYQVSHVDVLLRARPDRPRLLERPVGAVARVAVNVLYIAWAVAVARSAA
ncbi:MauE/DoxX family redox-associated membrane protein [Streptomyces sp. CoH27]|uniref:MauE/DoxX family redox-associated membrane protein n=1 Tax=Streptomyces sp. CoH27 TaxID=2875763 RepID=UPI001CD45FA4|nr:MauE/DoxX family redox-associated membrane protein [Streptomyces sp. CoH27]